MVSVGPTTGGGSIPSKPSCADRPHYHSGIFFLLASIFDPCEPNCAVICKSEPRKNFALSNSYGVTKSDGSADASAIASKLGYLFSSTLKSADTPCAKKTSRNWVGVGTAHAVFLKKRFRAHVGFFRRPELMSGLPDRKLPWS